MKNKKAQVFTVIAIVLIGLMFVSFEVFSVVEQRQNINTRISTMESFLFSIEENLERQVFISSFRMIFLAENEIITTGGYIPNTNDFFQEAFFLGTVNGEPADILLGATYDELINSINQKASKVNVDVTFSNPVLTITQEDPWNIKFTLTTDFVLEDISGLAKWDKQQVITAYVPVEGFLDPIYTKNSNALVLRKITQTPYTTFVPVSNLLDHTQQGYYIANTDAPNFLDRLQGNLNPDVNGIESLVYLPDLSAQGIPTPSKSSVDHIYFSTSNPSSTSVSGMPSWFKLDTTHQGIYTI